MAPLAGTSCSFSAKVSSNSVPMINEGIDIFNEENNETRPFFDSKKIGRLLTEVGLDKAVSSVSNTVIESTKSDEKN